MFGRLGVLSFFYCNIDMEVLLLVRDRYFTFNSVELSSVTNSDHSVYWHSPNIIGVLVFLVLSSIYVCPNEKYVEVPMPRTNCDMNIKIVGTKGLWRSVDEQFSVLSGSQRKESVSFPAKNRIIFYELNRYTRLLTGQQSSKVFWILS